MSKANEPAYPVVKTSHENGTINGEQWHYGNTYSTGGPTMREKLAMEIYVKLAYYDIDKGAEEKKNAEYARFSLRAADIFFEQLNK